MDKDQSIISKAMDVKATAKLAKQAASNLASMTAKKRNEVLELIASRLQKEQNEILAANQTDVLAAGKIIARGEMSEPLLNRLKLDSAKIAELVAGTRYLTALDDPLGKITLARELDEGLCLYRITCPIGVIGVIFESRPDALLQIATLCIKSGNASILKGGAEAQNSNSKLFELIARALTDSGFPAHTVNLLESRQDIEKLLHADESIDLIIPRGSNELVKHIQNNTRIPVLGHAEGICHIYVDQAADLEQAIKIIVDAKVQYPAACNAVETLLVHKDVASNFLPLIIDELIKHKVTLKADEPSKKILNQKDIASATADDWSKEYCDLILAIKIVDSLEDAINHINTYGSGHTDTIITENSMNSQQFFASVNSAGVFINASTRFADGFRYGFGAEVGISTSKLHPRGPVGLEGLVTYKYKLVGHGHIVQDYSGTQAKKFSHRTIGER